MIEKLTKEQENKFQHYVDKWLKIGLSTDQVDKEKAESAASEAYEVVGLNRPKEIV